MAQLELLLVSPPDYSMREFRGAQPLGIAYLASSLRDHGIPCRLLDANVGRPLTLEALGGQIDAFVTHCRAGGGRPVVGFSAVTQVIHHAMQGRTEP